MDGFKPGMKGKMSDVAHDGVSFTIFTGDQIPTTNTHGTGCTLSSEIDSGLSRGRPIPNAVAEAKVYLADTLSHSFPLGEGHPPANHILDGGPVTGRKAQTEQPAQLTENPHERLSHTSSSAYRIWPVNYRYS